MHSSEQQSADEAQEQQESQPLYEFPPGGPLLNEPLQPAPVTRVLPEAEQEAESEPSHETGQQGFVYPPPPSYYQNMPQAPQAPVLPPVPQGVVGKQEVPSRSAYEPQRPMPPRGVQFYPPPGPPPDSLQPQAKKSYKWVWIVVSVLSVAVLASCGLCGWGVYTLFASSYQQVLGSLDVVNDYYTDLQSQNYSAAYSDLAPQGQISGLTQEQYIQQATKLDTQYGPVVSFVPGQPGFSTNANGGLDQSRLNVTVNVRRTHLSYTVLLTVSKIGGNWKITEYDRL